MVRRFLGRVIFLRHGQTEYTDMFPDLTGQGIRTIKKSAGLIRSIIQAHQSVAIVASPMVRAQGSAAVLANELGYKGKIREDPVVAAAIIKDKKRGKALFDEHVANGGMRALSISYGTDPRYEDGEVIEPRSAVRERFFSCFTKLIRQFLVNTGLLPCVVIISHYEFLYHFIESIFELNYKKDEPLGHGEIIEISFFDIGIENVVEIEVIFRKKTIIKNFDYAQKEII